MRRKNFVSLVLMILSMVLLTGFVAYWLNNQFNEEKSNLQDRFLQQFISSQDQVIDSVLIEYLHPIIGDSAMAFSRPGELADTSFRHKTITTIKIDTGHDSLVGSQGTFIAVGNGEDTAHGALSLIDFSVSAKEEFFLRGVKMVMKISGDSINSFSSAGDGMPLTDTLLLKELFADRILKTTGREFSTRWFMDTSKPKENKQAWYFSANHLDPNITVEVTSVSPYVFKQIIPQILFAIILLLLSGSAFFFTYRSLKRQMELNTIREEFISNISHELKTPVATAKVALEALQNYQQIENPDIAADYLQMASSELDRLDRLTQKVLSHSQLEGNYLSLERKKTDLVLLCRELIDKLGPRCRKDKALISFSSSDPEISANIDPLYIEGVLINLIDNGIKYAGPEARIDIQLSQKSDNIILSVTDNGHGIPKAYHKLVFDKFFRVPADNRHNVKGYGLGLSFAALVMEQHGGSISVDNHPAGGCIFELNFRSLQDEG